MTAKAISVVMRNVRTTVLKQQQASLTDGQLLGCFIDKRDGDAFAALVRLHGPMF
jgi:hypothetical protein